MSTSICTAMTAPGHWQRVWMDILPSITKGESIRGWAIVHRSRCIMWVLEMAEGWERQPLFPHKIFYTAGKLWGLPPKNFPGKKLSGLQRESKYVLLLNQLRNTFFLSNKWGTPKWLPKVLFNIALAKWRVKCKTQLLCFFHRRMCSTFAFYL